MIRFLRVFDILDINCYDPMDRCYLDVPAIVSLLMESNQILLPDESLKGSWLPVNFNACVQKHSRACMPHGAGVICWFCNGMR